MDSEPEAIATIFEGRRSHLRGVAYRMLGSLSEAEDAVQEAWLRLSRSDANSIENLHGWLTTVVAKICLDLLRSRKVRREDALDAKVFEAAEKAPKHVDPEQEALLADSVGLALLAVLDTLPPAERVAFILHDVPFEEIAQIVGRNTAAARQLASRARKRVRGRKKIQDPVLKSHRIVVDNFLAALRAGDVEGILAVLDPDVVVRTDISVRPPGMPAEVHGARNWAPGAVAFGHLARFVQPALINGRVGLIFAPRGRLSRALTVKIADGRITEIDIIADRERLDQLELAVLRESSKKDSDELFNR
jgi:RNA polymerase sigma factor (sigma-70 family)